MRRENKMDLQNIRAIHNHVEGLFPGLKIKVDATSKGYFVRYFDGPSLMNFSKTLLGGDGRIEIINGVVDGFVDIDGVRHPIRISREYTYKTMKPVFEKAMEKYKDVLGNRLILDTLGNPVYDDSHTKLTIKGILSPFGALALAVKSTILSQLEKQSFDV